MRRHITSGIVILLFALGIGLALVAAATLAAQDAEAFFGGSGTLVITKEVVNDNGASGDAEGFSFEVKRKDVQNMVSVGRYFFANQGSGLAGEKDLWLPPGLYEVTEDAYPARGYTIAYEGCGPGTLVSVEAGGTATCAIVNDDIAPSVTLLAEVSGGSAAASAWTLSATGPSVLSGTSGIVSGSSFMVGSYELAAEGPAGYGLSWSCDLNDPDGATAFSGTTLTVEEGDEVVCTATLAYDPPACETGFHDEHGACVPDEGGSGDPTEPSCPEGQHPEGEVCVPDVSDGGDGGSETPADSCPNVDGIQDGVPDDMRLDDEGQCVDEDSIGSAGGKRSSSGRRGGEVLGASTCAAGIKGFLKMGGQNDTEDVTKLQAFLNEHLGLSIPVTGFFGPATYAAVKAFQKKYWEDVLKPWFSHAGSGIDDEHDATGYVYQTTKWKLNNLICEGSESFPDALI